jgi:TetR/AcrR family transcriptional regulator of autoinduction and epiphytic fitness
MSFSIRNLNEMIATRGSEEKMQMQEREPSQDKPRGGRPSRQEAEEVSRRIMETATQLFATQGFAGTSVEQIAARCRVGKDTIYRRFPSKVALFDGVVEHAHRRVIARVNGISFAALEPMAYLRDLLRCFLSINMERDLIALKRINLSEAVASGRREPTSPKVDPLMDMLVDAVRAGQTAGALRGGDPVLMAEWLIHGLVSVPTTDAMLGGSRYQGRAALDAYFDRVWPWLLNGADARAGS